MTIFFVNYLKLNNSIVLPLVISKPESPPCIVVETQPIVMGKVCIWIPLLSNMYNMIFFYKKCIFHSRLEVKRQFKR